MFKLDLSSLSNSIKSLEEGITEYEANRSSKLLRDGCIQRFEYTYELSHKMLRRYLEHSESDSSEIDNLSFPSLIRLAFERGLIKNSWDIWSVFRESRNISSHTYDESKAVDVYSHISKFLEEAKYLYTKLNTLI